MPRAPVPIRKLAYHPELHLLAISFMSTVQIYVSGKSYSRLCFRELYLTPSAGTRQGEKLWLLADSFSLEETDEEAASLVTGLSFSADADCGWVLIVAHANSGFT